MPVDAVAASDEGLSRSVPVRIQVRAVKLAWATLQGWPIDEDKPGSDEVDQLLARADLGILPIFEDERPLSGLAAYVDWRGNGRVTRWLDQGLFAGRVGERLLCPGSTDIALDRLVLLGLGRREDFDEPAALAFADAVLAQARALRASEVVLSWPSVEASAAHDVAVDRLLSQLRETGAKLAAAGPGAARVPPQMPAEDQANEAGAESADSAGDESALGEGEVRPAAEPATHSEPSPDPGSALPTPRWWLVTPGPLFTRLRGRVLGTPQAAAPA